jgi:signal transduction histidine kinase
MSATARGAAHDQLSAPASAHKTGGAGATVTVSHASVPLICEMLARAAWVAGENWEPSVRNPATVEAINAAIQRLADTVRHAIEGQAPSLEGLPATLPWRRLLEALHSGFLQVLQTEIAEGVEAKDALSALFAFEEVRHALDRDVALRFASRLSGQDGADLLVEVAHDMRSPLGSILFLAERLHQGQSGTINPVQERQLGLIYSAAWGLSLLASDVIELARGGDRLVDHDPIPFSVNETMTSVYDIVKPMAEEKGLTVSCRPPEVDYRVGFPSALNRVLLNLTTNSLKFTVKGGVEINAKQLDRTHVEFCVTDSGRGIPNSVLQTLFEPFRPRVAVGQYAFSSAGLGLSICQKLIRAMGGELKVETEIEKGTRFSFVVDLPVPTRI